jgi:hypothetical protein
VTEHLLATAIDVLAAANWQRGGGKSPRPKPLQRPDPKEEQRKRDLSRRLSNLGLLDDPPPPDPTPSQLQQQGDAVWLEQQRRLASE